MNEEELEYWIDKYSYAIIWTTAFVPSRFHSSWEEAQNALSIYRTKLESLQKQLDAKRQKST